MVASWSRPTIQRQRDTSVFRLAKYLCLNQNISRQPEGDLSTPLFPSRIRSPRWCIALGSCAPIRPDVPSRIIPTCRPSCVYPSPTIDCAPICVQSMDPSSSGMPLSASRTCGGANNRPDRSCLIGGGPFWKGGDTLGRSF